MKYGMDLINLRTDLLIKTNMERFRPSSGTQKRRFFPQVFEAEMGVISNNYETPIRKQERNTCGLCPSRLNIV